MQPPIEAPEEKKIEEEEERGRLTGAAIADEDELEGGVPHGRGVRESLRTRHHITRNPLLITTRTTSQQINADHPKSPNHSRSRRINDPIIQTPAASRRINRNKPTKQKTSITVERERENRTIPNRETFARNLFRSIDRRRRRWWRRRRRWRRRGGLGRRRGGLGRRGETTARGFIRAWARGLLGLDATNRHGGV